MPSPSKLICNNVSFTFQNSIKMLAALKAEIAAKRKKLEESGVMENGQKYFKRAKLYASSEDEVVSKIGEPSSPTKGIHRSTSKESPTKDCFSSADTGPLLARAEVVRRLRDREVPIALFGESEVESFRRLRKLEITEPEINRGQRNDFQEAMSNVDKAYLQELLKFQNKDDKKDVDLGEVKLCMEDLIELSKKLRDESTIDKQCKIVMQFIDLLLQEWAKNLNSRAEANKMTVHGKRDAATFNQTRCYLKPLRKHLKKKTLPEDILECLVEIVQYCLDRNYVGANDAYLQMAIGNAPWPIGVTMVGIHARTGREKIFSKHVAHVLNDETQRKYIQGLKRLITKCQEYYTTVPSMCVEYKAVQS